MNSKVDEIEKEFVKLVRKKIKTKEEVQQMDEWGDLLSLELKKESRELLSQIKKIGFSIESVWDLVNTSKSYKEALPILTNHLKVPYNWRTKEGIIRSLAVKEAKGIANEPLKKLYESLDKNEMYLKWVVANTLNVIVRKEDIDKYIEYIKDKDNGMSRDMIILAIGKYKKFRDEKVKKVLIDVIKDEKEDVSKDSQIISDAIKVLSKYKDKEARDIILEFKDHENEVIRKEAQKALKSMDEI